MSANFKSAKTRPSIYTLTTFLGKFLDSFKKPFIFNLFVLYNNNSPKIQIFIPSFNVIGLNVLEI